MTTSARPTLTGSPRAPTAPPQQAAQAAAALADIFARGHPPSRAPRYGDSAAILAAELADVRPSMGAGAGIGAALTMEHQKTAAYSFELSLRLAVVLAGAGLRAYVQDRISDLAFRARSVAAHLPIAELLQDWAHLVAEWGRP